MPRTVKKTKDLVTGEPDKPVGLTAKANAEWDGTQVQVTRAHSLTGVTR